MGNKPEVGRPSSPCEMRESLVYIKHGLERRLNYFRMVHVVNNETKGFEMFWATSFSFSVNYFGTVQI